MRISVRKAGAGIAALTAATFAAGAAIAQDFPAKTVEVVTHAGAGGGTDVTTRMMMCDIVPVVIELFIGKIRRNGRSNSEDRRVCSRSGGKSEHHRAGCFIT